MTHTAPTKEDAEVWAAKQTVQASTGIVADAGSLSVQQYLATWLSTVSGPLAGHTVVTYTTSLKGLVELLGNIRLSKLGPMQIQQAINHEIASGLAPKTVRTHLGVFRNAMRQAIAWHLLSIDPTQGVKLPTRDDREMKVWSEQEVNQFLAHVFAHSRFGPLCHTALASGCRIGELLGLRWSYVDWARGGLRIECSLSWPSTANSTPEIKKTKSITSRRFVLLDKASMAVLKTHKSKQAQRQLGLGAAWENNDLVFPARDGSPYRHTMFNTRFKNLCKQAGVPRIRVHDMRHTHATILLQHGRPLKEVSERLGHKDPALTLRTYAHVLADQHEESARVIGEVFRPRGPREI